MAINTSTDRPKSVRNRFKIFKIEVFGGVFVLSRCFFDFFWGRCRGICHRTESDLFLFLLVSALVRYFESVWLFISGLNMETNLQN